MIADLSRTQMALGALCAALALTLLYELFAPLPAYSIPDVHIANAVTLPPLPPPFVAPSRDAFATIGDRPLFDATRKKYVPPPTPAEKAAAAPPPPPNVTLVGVILDGQTKLAIVRTPDAALASSLQLGAQIGGWQLSEIEPDRIVLKLGTSQDEVRLDANKGPPQAASRPMGMTMQQQPGQPHSTP